MCTLESPVILLLVFKFLGLVSPNMVCNYQRPTVMLIIHILYVPYCGAKDQPSQPFMKSSRMANLAILAGQPDSQSSGFGHLTILADSAVQPNQWNSQTSTLADP
jgi:hypothetical protein